MNKPDRILRFEISDKNRKLRLIVAAIFLAIGLIAIGVGFMNLLNRDTGWQEVEVVSTESNSGSQFVLHYQLSGSGAEATALYKQVSAIYTEACEKTYQLLQVDLPSEEYENLYDINHDPGSVLTVDPVLYGAFEKLADTRYLYLGPVYSYYSSLILGTEESFLPMMDPALSQEARDYVSQMAAFASNEEHVQLQLLGNNQVKLFVSDAYRAFAAENEIEDFLDFRYMANAFIIDYIAESLQEKGYTRGYIVSLDGYTRVLDSQEQFHFTIFAREGENVHPAGVMAYQGPVSMVWLKDYPLAETDVFYRQSADHVIHTIADPADGMYRTSIPQLVSYSYDKGCADVLLSMLPCVAGTEFRLPQGVESVWCQGRTICYTDGRISFPQLLRDDGIAFDAQLQK